MSASASKMFERMKNKYICMMAIAITAFSLTACMDQTDEPPVAPDPSAVGFTSSTSVGEVNTTINELKQLFSSYITSNNTFVKVEKDLVFEATVVGNDVSGNLYQTLLLREILDDGTDQFIQVGIKNTHISPFFPLGQSVRININGLYIGNYSYVPKIGTPYKTSAGNIRLGPMLVEDCRTHVQLVTGPSDEEKDALLTPIAVDGTWLSSSANRNKNNTPMLATVEGTFSEADGERIFAPDVPEAEDPENGYDAGYARNRKFVVDGTEILVRTSTRNEISYTIIPSGRVKVTGMLTYYNKEWQLQMRDLNDLEILDE